jgi:allantoin racemase
MRIYWQSFVDGGQNAAYLERLAEYLNGIADSDTQVVVRGMSPPDRDFGRLTEFRCSILAVDNAIAAEAEGFDGYVFGHFQDPGLYEARSAVRIPVVGAGEATLHIAAQYGRRIGLVSIDSVFEVFHLEQAERYGLASRVTQVVGAIAAGFCRARQASGRRRRRRHRAGGRSSRPAARRGARPHRRSRAGHQLRGGGVENS